MKATALCVTALLALAMVLGYRACARAIRLAGRFTSEKITLTFRSNLDKVTSTQGDILELATLDGDELFRASSIREAFGINLGTTVAEIQARATFRYHLRLSDRWTLDVKSNICVVRAPALRASLPVAIHTDQMHKYAQSGWARFDKHEQMAQLESSITPELALRAVDERHLQAVREACRRSVGQFVKTWLMREDYWRKDRFTAIVVEFPDDATFAPSPDITPVIRLRQ